MDTCDKLAEFVRLMNVCGPDSWECQQFLREHANDTEFVELAELSITLKKALCDRLP